MENRRTSRTNYVTTFAFFGLTTTIAIVLLITALVVWLTQLLGSVIASTLLVGGFFAVLSLVIYWLAIRDAVENIRTQFQTVYEVARLAQAGYEWVSEKILLFMNLRGK